MVKQYGAVLLVALAAGSSIVMSRFALTEIPATLLLTLRMAIGSACFGLMFALTKPNLALERRVWLDGLVVGLLSIGLPLEISFFALQYLSSGLFTILLSFTGMATLLVAHFFLPDEAVTPGKLLGAGVAFVGVVVLISTRATGLVQQAGLQGYVYVLGVVLLFSTGNVYARRRLRQVEPLVATAIGMAASFIISLPFALTTGWDSLGQISGWSWAAAVYGGTVGSFLQLSGMYWLIKKYGASIAGLTYFVIPVVSTILGMLLLSEIIPVGMLAGAALVFIGLVLVNRPDKTLALSRN